MDSFEDYKDTNFKIKEAFEIVLEFDKEEKNLIISSDNSSGASYDCDDYKGIINAIQNYIYNYIDYDKEIESQERER